MLIAKSKVTEKIYNMVGWIKSIIGGILGGLIGTSLILVMFLVSNENQSKYGSLADWLGVFGTTSAVGIALWQSFFGIQRDQRIKDKRIYSKKLVTNIISLNSMVNDVKELFITEFNPEARQNWELGGSDVDAITKTSLELKTDIYITINEMEKNLKLANIDKFISKLQKENVLNEVEKAKDNMIGLFKSIQDTENGFAIMESARKSYESHDMLNDTERHYYEGTMHILSKFIQDLKDLEEMVIDTF